MSWLRNTFFVTALVALTASVSGQTNLIYAWRTYSGQPGGPGNADGARGAARYWYPAGVAADSGGNLYVADTYNHTIRKIASDGVVTTLAGSPGQFGAADGSGNIARFTSPCGLAVDSNGVIYVADAGNVTIRKVTSDGVVTTLAGSPGQPGSADGTGGAVRFDQPKGIAVDLAGNVYVADAGNSTIRKVTSSGVVTTLAGIPGQTGSADGTGSAARFYYPAGVAVDGLGNVYVADLDNDCIRKVTAGGVVTTLAGSAGQAGSADGTGGAARFYFPSSVAVDSAGNVYVADTFNSIIRKVTSGGVVTTLAGALWQTGNVDGTGGAARFFHPAGVATDNGGNVFVADTDNHTIRKVRSNGMVTTVAGSAGRAGSSDAVGSLARFNGPLGVTVGGGGTVYVADSGNGTIRKVTSAGLVATLAGSPGQSGSADGSGDAARFSSPSGVAADSSGIFYVADSGNATIRKITSDGVVTTLAGSPGQTGSADGTGGAARFGQPVAVALDNAGNLYVSDFASNTLRKVTSDGVVTTLAGSPGQPGSADGTGSAARFSGPIGTAVDAAGNVYVADSQNKTIRRVTADGIVTTLAGSPGQPGSADGTGSAARFFYPFGVALGPLGNLYVADASSCTIRRVTSAGMVTTLAGSPGQAGSQDGTGSAARFSLPSGVAVDAGNVLVVELGNHTLRKVANGGVVTTLAGKAGLQGSADAGAGLAQCSGPTAVGMDGAGNLFVADSENHTIRKVTADGVVTTLAGGPGQPGSADGGSSAARFNQPNGVAVDVAGNVYVADSFNNTIRKVAGGVVVTFAGTAGVPGSADGTGSAARFSYPSGLAVDLAGNMYVTDFDNSTLRQVTSLGAVTTLAGSAGQPGSADGTGSTARFDKPNGVAADSAGNLYVADSGNFTLRMVTSGGVVTTLAGSAGQAGSADGIGGAARFGYPMGVAVDKDRNVFVADAGNSTIRMVNSNGVVTTIGGIAQVIGGADGVGGSAKFAVPCGVAVDGAGRLFVADAGNNRLSRGVRVPTLSILRSEAGVIVSWPSPSPGFALQEGTGNLNVWGPSASSISDDGTNKSVTVAAPVGARFFRLAQD